MILNGSARCLKVVTIPLVLKRRGNNTINPQVHLYSGIEISIPASSGLSPVRKCHFQNEWFYDTKAVQTAEWLQHLPRKPTLTHSCPEVPMLGPRNPWARKLSLRGIIRCSELALPVVFSQGWHCPLPDNFWESLKLFQVISIVRCAFSVSRSEVWSVLYEFEQSLNYEELSYPKCQ